MNTSTLYRTLKGLNNHSHRCEPMGMMYSVFTTPMWLKLYCLSYSTPLGLVD